MDRDYDGRLSFGEFMGEETPLEKVVMVVMVVVVMFDASGVQEHGQGWEWNSEQR